MKNENNANSSHSSLSTVKKISRTSKYQFLIKIIKMTIKLKLSSYPEISML